MKTDPRLSTTGCHITAIGSYVRIALDLPREHAYSCLRQLCGTRWLVALLVVALLLPGCGEETAPTPAGTTQEKGLSSGLTTYADQTRTVKLVDAADITALREQAAEAGKVLVIDCWATWCGSCVAMFPHLHKAMKERGDGVMLASLCFDEGQDIKTLTAVRDFLEKHDAWDNAYQAAAGSDATDAIAKALSDNWSGTILPAVFVYRPDGTTAYELLETRGEVQDWVDAIAQAVDRSLQDANDSPGE